MSSHMDGRGHSLSIVEKICTGIAEFEYFSIREKTIKNITTLPLINIDTHIQILFAANSKLLPIDYFAM